MEPHYYNVDIEWKSERKGIAMSPELTISGNKNNIEVATPPEFPKGMPGIWSPEHLFTAAISSCLMTTFLSIAENSKLEFNGFVCKAKGKLETVNGKLIMSEVYLEPVVTITDEKDRDKAERVLQKAEAACLISNSVNSEIRMTPLILIR